MSSISDVAAEQRAIERICSTSGLSYKWLQEGETTPYTDYKAKTVHLPKPLPTWSQHEWRMLRAYIYHECGHHHPDQQQFWDLIIAEGYDFKGDFGFALNAIDDIWQEMTTSRGYIGAAQDLSYTQGYFCDKTGKDMASGMQAPPFALKVMTLAYEARADWQPDVSLTVDGLKNYHVPEWEGLADRINKIIDHPTPAEELVAIVKQLFDDDPESEQSGEEAAEENKEQANKSESSDKSEDGEGEAGSAGTGNGDEGEEDGEGSGGVLSYKDLLMHSHDDSDKETTPSGPLKIIYDHEPAFDYDPYPLDLIVEGKASKINHRPNDFGHYIAQECTNQRATASKLRRIFQSTSQRSKVYQKKRGKLTTKHLPRILHGDERLFNKTTTRVDDTADVYLLCDGSGSMYGDKYRVAGAALISLSEALAAAKVDHKVAVFADRYGHCHHYVIKDWQERPDKDKMIEEFNYVDMCGNADGDSILHAMRDLNKRKAKRRLLIVLSDGQPASYRDGDCMTFTQEAVKKCSQVGIECYGIGLMDYSVDAIYPESTVIHEASDIEPCLSELIKSKILKR